MRTRTAWLLTGILALSACAAVEDITGPSSKAAARSVVGPIVREQVPGEIGAALTECILDSATEQELIVISAANAGAPAADIVLLVSDILARDATVACASTRLATA